MRFDIELVDKVLRHGIEGLGHRLVLAARGPLRSDPGRAISGRPRPAAGPVRSDQVNDREEDDPDEVDEVPVEPGELDGVVVGRE